MMYFQEYVYNAYLCCFTNWSLISGHFVIRCRALTTRNFSRLKVATCKVINNVNISISITKSTYFYKSTNKIKDIFCLCFILTQNWKFWFVRSRLPSSSCLRKIHWLVILIVLCFSADFFVSVCYWGAIS